MYFDIIGLKNQNNENSERSIHIGNSNTFEEKTSIKENRMAEEPIIKEKEAAKASEMNNQTNPTGNKDKDKKKK